NLPRTHGDREEAQPERVERSILSSRLGGLRFQISWIEHESVGHHQRKNSNRNVDVEAPPPAVIVRDVAAERRSHDRGEQRSNTENRLGGTLFLFRESVEQHALTRRLQSAASKTL